METHSYVCNGSQLTQETVTTKTTTGSVTATTTEVLYSAYDASGNPLSVTLTDANGTEITYYYAINLQGDVTAILTTNGTEVVEYTYDAWGNPLTVAGSLADALGKASPLRYRGYVYDAETELYYLQSRYYNPNTGRFINADGKTSDVSGDVLGYNMFAYCFNNPVMRCDSTGNWPNWLENAVKAVSAVVVVVAAVATVAAVSAFTAGTGTAAAVYGSTILLGAALSGINGGIANETNGNSYANGYVGGAISGAIQSSASKLTGGTVWGGALGTGVGTAITMGLNNLDPDSADSTTQEIVSSAVTSGKKALVTSSLTAYMGYASNLAAINGANGLMQSYTVGFSEAVKAFFGAVDDALVYIWE